MRIAPRPTVALVMIVRDEEDVIERCLLSALSHIDSWVIVDTGSTDNTPRLVEKTLNGVPGKLHRSKWRDFAHNRSEALQLARGTADFLLLLDADMVLQHDGALPNLTEDIYLGRIQGTLDYALPILIRGAKQWRYEGVAHSYLHCDQPTTETVLSGLEIEDGSHVTEEKLRRDLELLSAEHGRNPLDARTAFYLAQTYFDLGMTSEAIQMYRYRANLPGFAEETFYARYRLGVLLGEHVSFAEAVPELLAAWQMRPGRIEPLRALANLANSVADKAIYPNDLLFVHRCAYKDEERSAA